MSERAVIDMRLHVTGDDKLDVWRRVTEFQPRAKLVAGPGIDVRYTQLRQPRSRTFEATMAPAPRRTKRESA